LRNRPPVKQRIFEEICKGKSPAQIAELLGRSEYTVSNHIKEIYKVFGVNSRSALVAAAIQRGLVKTG
jgi:DNA-binding CsgD family transcriptional regulator